MFMEELWKGAQADYFDKEVSKVEEGFKVYKRLFS